MTSLELYATLTAALTDAEPGEPNHRVAEGIIAPYGVPGRTSAGLKRIAPGALRQVEGAPVIGLYGHRAPGAEPRGVSRLIASEERPEGLWGRLRIADTPDGNLLLAELRGGVREGLSVELSDVAYHPSDHDLVTSARLDAVAHVPLPAYDSARVSALAASLNDPTGDSSVTAPAPTAAPETAAPAAAPAAPQLDYAQLAAALAPHLTAAAAPAGLPTGGALTAAPAAPAPASDGAAQLERLCAMQAQQAQGDVSLNAALADITNTNQPLFQRPAGEIPRQLWANSGYKRRFVPMLTPVDLVSYKFSAFEFTDGPEVDDWAGDKAQIPTNTFGDTREVDGTAQRLAGGWDVDRKFRDFGDALFWSKFYAAQTESYARKSDAKALAAMLAAAQDITDTDPVDGYTRPTGWTPAAQADVLRAVGYGSAYLEDTPLVEQGPDWVIMNTQDWLGLLDLTNLDLPAFLALLNVQPGSFQRSSRVPRGSVLLGVKRALEWHELPGAAPIRVEALDVARGGIDSAVFGYWGTLHVRPGGIISVPLTAG